MSQLNTSTNILIWPQMPKLDNFPQIAEGLKELNKSSSFGTFAHQINEQNMHNLRFYF